MLDCNDPNVKLFFQQIFYWSLDIWFGSTKNSACVYAAASSVSRVPSQPMCVPLLLPPQAVPLRSMTSPMITASLCLFPSLPPPLLLLLLPRHSSTGLSGMPVKGAAVKAGGGEKKTEEKRRLSMPPPPSLLASQRKRL